MKYKVGDKTLLGEIINADDGDTRYPYSISVAFGKFWFSESEIDKIIIKPKRNIDHIIELPEDGKEEAARKFYNDLVPLSEGYAVADEIYYFLKPYTEPSKYPQLTPEELKAVKWLVDGGFETLERTDSSKDRRVFAEGKNAWMHVLYSPKTEILDKADWIDMFAINLKELLDAQEVSK